MTAVTATDIQNNFGRYLSAVIEGEEIIIIKNGKEVARLISKNSAATYLTDSLTGVLKNNYNEKDVAEERYSKA